MALHFDPQFFRKITDGEFAGFWVPASRPTTVLAVKSSFYARWQEEERKRLLEAGEKVKTPQN